MIKPGFFGKTPPRFWIGQVPLGQTDNKTSYKKWGDRVKVRIIGYHPSEGSLLKDEDLPWAIVLRSTCHGSLNRVSTGIVGGEWVMGIFLDDDYEKPYIIGVFGRSDPSYSFSISDEISKSSTEFKKTLNYFGSIVPSPANLYGSGDTTPKGKKEPQTDVPKNSFRRRN